MPAGPGLRWWWFDLDGKDNRRGFGMERRREPMGILFLLFVLLLVGLSGLIWVLLALSKYGWSLLATGVLLGLIVLGLIVLVWRKPVRWDEL